VSSGKVSSTAPFQVPIRRRRASAGCFSRKPNGFEEAPAHSSGGGRVTLVGAGPGDAELLTLKAVRALQAADVILFDDLVSSEVLELARREAKRMLVGKRGGRTSCRQEDINETMVKLAKAGKRVVRLKSGDPMIFGQGRRGDRPSRSREHSGRCDPRHHGCKRHGLAPRHLADPPRSCPVGPFHHRPFPPRRAAHDVNWATVADPQTTTVFYMGGRTAPAIAEKLVAEGLPPSTPTVIVSDVSRPTERAWRGSLATLSDGIGQIGYDNPVLIAVGSALAARRSEQDDNDLTQIAIAFERAG
jgi:uroporphyrin-III C-methyltransferase/precorrin-2 dehydrogenase/sirohydrochlorin ferrochelatase